MLIDKVFYIVRHAARLPFFIAQFIEFRKKITKFSCGWSDLLPILHEKSDFMQYDAHYIYHTGWAARVLRELAPKEHVDISSSLMFCAIASANTTVWHYDYRRPVVSLPNLYCGVEDVTRLSFRDSSISSLSCMHVIEHIGLGRYGDPVNSNGDVLAAKELARVLGEGGYLLVVVPVAENPVVRFNAHRIYDFKGVLSLFSELELVEFSFLNEMKDNQFIRFAKEVDVVGSRYGCGCFIFRKKKS